MTREVWLERGKASAQAGRHIEALKHFQTAIELDKGCAEAWYGRAQSLEEVGRYQSALEALERSRELDPDAYSALAWFAMGNCHVRLGDRRRAIRYYDQALQVAPHLRRVWHNRGTALFELGQYQEAAGSYARELELDSSRVETHVWRAWCLERLGRPESSRVPSDPQQELATGWMQVATHEYRAGDMQHALAAYDRACGLNPSMGWAWVGKGACLGALGQLENALGAFDRAVSLDDDSKSIAAVNRANLLKTMSKRGEAEDAYQRVLQAPADSLERQKAKAIALYASDSYQEAIETLAIVKRLDPHYAEACHIEGLCFDFLGRFAEAANSFGHFLELKPEQARVWFRRARALTASGQAEAGLECCDKAIELGFVSADSWLQKGITLGRLQRYMEAVSCLDRTLELQPDWDEALYCRGVCHYQLAECAAAIRDFDRMLEQGTSSAHSIMALHFKQQALTALGDADAAQSCAVTGMAYTAIAEERFDDAIQLFRKALAVYPANAIASLRLGALLVEHGAPEEAVEQMAHGLALRPKHVELWSTRGVMLSRLGRADEAMDCYAKALEVDPLYGPALRNAAIQLRAKRHL